MLLNQRPAPERVTAAVVGILLLSVAFALYHLFDFRIYWEAGHRLLEGQRLYPTSAELSRNTRDYFDLPPGVALAFAPLSLVPFVIAGALYSALAVAALIAAMWILGVRDPRCYIVLLFWMPVLQAIGLGTVGPFLTFALALSWHYRNRRLLGAVPLGLAIAAKLFLWPMLLWLLLSKGPRRAAEAAAVAIGVILIPWAVLGFRDLSWYPRFLRLLFDNERRTSWSTVSLLRTNPVGPPVLVVGLAILGLVIIAARSREGDRRAFSAAVFASLILSPLVWIHFYVLLLVPIALASRRFGWLWALPVLAWWPYTDTRSHVWVGIWVYGLMAAVALLTLAPAGSGIGAPAAADSA